jgi:hypothetical protein
VRGSGTGMQKRFKFGQNRTKATGTLHAHLRTFMTGLSADGTVDAFVASVAYGTRTHWSLRLDERSRCPFLSCSVFV